ncbi:TPA: LOW QUALITY PROTEIN: hypothetical protein N0F65_007967 [Lagenidium giganteum]|uniref:protein-tyrosine-phosphatase n=1 Tax=Lagenidium giganteum TaxID=4803 RepID=A0AAV2YIF0_9STRA|nr:TPA: LOW QUALITY PROTEIN: hypothetical protein N0F65_007967 [Lagenidium giganteum]
MAVSMKRNKSLRVRQSTLQKYASEKKMRRSQDLVSESFGPSSIVEYSKRNPDEEDTVINAKWSIREAQMREKSIKTRLLSYMNEMLGNPWYLHQPSVILDHVILGGSTHAHDHNYLFQSGVTHIINCASQVPNKFEGEFIYLKLNLQDSMEEDLIPHFQPVAKFIRRIERLRGRVLIHCISGKANSSTNLCSWWWLRISRSPSLLVAYLMIDKKMRLIDAYNLVRRKRKNVQPNQAFRLQLANRYDDGQGLELLHVERAQTIAKQRTPQQHDMIHPYSSTSTSCDNMSPSPPKAVYVKGASTIAGGVEEKNPDQRTMVEGAQHRIKMSNNRKETVQHKMLVMFKKYFRSDVIRLPPHSILPALWLGDERNASTHNDIYSIGITHICNLDFKSRNYFEGQFIYIKLNLLDTPDEKISPQFEAVNQFIEVADSVGGRAFVHCATGKSLAPAFAMAYLVGKKGMTLDDALHLVSSKHPTLKVYPTHFKQLRRYEQCVVMDQSAMLLTAGGVMLMHTARSRISKNRSGDLTGSGQGALISTNHLVENTILSQSDATWKRVRGVNGTPTSAVEMAIRDDLVAQGVRFLQHPRVQDTPLSERLAFLEKKGLTPQEIAKALKDNDEQNAAKAAKAVESVTSAIAGERLKDRVGVVVGGNTGLGELIALRLAKEGAKLAVLGHKTQRSTTFASSEAQIQPIHVAEGDLHDWAFVDAAYAKVAADHGRIDFVVNCIPVTTSDKVATAATSFVDVDTQQWDVAMGVSAKAVFLSCKRAVQQMLQQDNQAIRGRIVNVSSVYGGMIARKGQFTFGVAKSVAVQLTRQIAVEYAGSGIVCNAVAPGFIDDSTNKEDCVPPAMNNRIPAQAPGKAADVANAVLFLVSDETRYVHGVNVLVDGGMMAS